MYIILLHTSLTLVVRQHGEDKYGPYKKELYHESQVKQLQ